MAKIILRKKRQFNPLNKRIEIQQSVKNMKLMYYMAKY